MKSFTRDVSSIFPVYCTPDSTQNPKIMLIHFFSNPFSDVLGYENGSIGAATITVIVVHVIIGLYIWVAIQEEQQPKPLKKD